MFRFLSLNAVDGLGLSWDEHPHSSSHARYVSGLVNTLGVVGAICRHGRHLIVDSPKQGGYPSRVTRSVTGQIRGHDLARARIHRKVQLSPGPLLGWSPQMTDMDPETGAVDEQADRALARDRRKVDYPQVLEPPGQRRMVGNGELQLEHVGQGTQEALSLSKRKVEDHANRQSCLNRGVRVGVLAAGQGPPGVDGVVRKPDGQVTPFA